MARDGADRVAVGREPPGTPPKSVYLTVRAGGPSRQSARACCPTLTR